jgi:DNA-binding NtrC family response regulator
MAGVGVGVPARAAGGTMTEEADDSDPDSDDQPPSGPVGVAASGSGGSKLAEIAKSAAMKAERTIIEDTLQQVHWNRRRAAEQLGVSYKTLLNKIKECGISRQ